MIGKKFGKLTVLELSDYRGVNNRDKYYICQCDCGEVVQLMGTSLRRKGRPTLNCKQCGNKKKEKHGMVGSRLYKIWDGMKQRCLNENDVNYHYYGGRGIKICNEWLDKEVGMLNFKEWSLTNGYNESLTIDRINNNGDYEPSNCRWVDMKVQANNKSINKLITYKGVTKTLSQWSEEYNIPYVTFVKRIDSGWDIERALTDKVTQKRKKLVEIEGELYTYEQLGEMCGVTAHTIVTRYSRGKRGKELIL